jgi:hypothetical protein
MKKRPESVTYFSSKNGLLDAYNDDDDVIFNSFINENQRDIQEQFELSTALSISASEASLTESENIDNTLPSDCEIQLKALQKSGLCIINNSKNFIIFI